MPKISVIVPVYNVEKYLNRCVDSILNQTYQDFELILVDDGSPDNCGKICDEYAEKFSKITVIHKENGGLSDARNAGIDWSFANSDSEWLTFIDSDDWIHSQYLELLYNANEKNGTQIAMAGIFITDDYVIENLDNTVAVIERPEDAFRKLSLDPESSCARLYKKELFSEIRFPYGKWHEDRFTSYKLLFKFDKITVIDSPLYYYFANNDGITHSSWNLRKLDLVEAAENQLDFFKKTQNEEMYRYILDDYIKILTRNMFEIRSIPEYKPHYKTLQKKLRKTIKSNKGYLNISLKSEFNTYKYAYPITAKVYRRIVTGVLRRKA